MRRRHSGSGLRRKAPALDSDDRGDLAFFEETEYAGDDEEEVFTMEKDSSNDTDQTKPGPAPSPNEISEKHFETPDVGSAEDLGEGQEAEDFRFEQ